MPIKGVTGKFKTRLASVLFAGGVFLLPVENVWAIANINLSSSFTAVDTNRDTPAVAVPYMDTAGTWNGGAEATNTSGDTFTLRVQNTGADPAFDIDIDADLPVGFRLPAGAFPVTVVSPSACDTTTGVTDFTGITASQTGNQVNFNIPNNRNIPNGCTYDFSIGLTTNDAIPFATPGLNNIDYDFSYDDGGPGLLSELTHQVQVNNANVALSKTAITAIAANGQTVDFTVAIVSAGAGGIFDVELTDTLSANLTGLNFISFDAFDNTTNNPVALPPGAPGPGANQYTFEYIPTNVRVEIGVRATATVNPTDTTCPDMTNDATAVERTGISSSDFATVDFNLANSLQLTHDLANSYCELCGIGEIRLTANNAGGISLVNINLTEDLMASGLTYVVGSTSISLDGAPAVPAADPTVSGANGQLLTWTPAQIGAFNQLDSPFAIPAPPNPISVEIIFQVQRAAGFNEEGLASAIRNIEATANYGLICGGILQNTSGGILELPIRQATPQVVKQGRNTDAGQGVGAYADIVYGHIDDDVIWRVDVQNTGLADLEDLLIDDTIGGNFDINWVCNSEANATNATNFLAGPAPPGCVSAGGGVRTSVLNFAVDDPFGNPNNDENTAFVDSPAGGNAFIYYVGRIRSFCTNHTNNADIEWGCEADSPPDGGLTTPATNSGVPPAFVNADFADLSTSVVTAGLDVQQAVTGTNVAQPVGSKGLVTIQITNLTGGTVRNLQLDDVLPVEYVVDSTFTPTAVVTPAYGAAYPGMIDTITWDNPAGTPLGNTAPHYTLTSSTAGADPLHDHLLRHGDVLVVQFGIVLIDASRYDLVADLDVAPENLGDGTDPDNTFTLSNQVTVDFENICAPINNTQVVDTDNAIAAFPEDLDVDISDALFILTNDPGTPLALNVLMTNNGGHDADDYSLYITLGQAMTAQLPLPAGCAATSNPPPHPHWNQPAPIPATAAVYLCDRGAIAPGITETFTFNVIKSAPGADDDLTFRADLVGEITLSDGTLLSFPPPATIANTTPALQLANNYSLDAVRSRVLGFNLTKTSLGNCTENTLGLPFVQIGEDCEYHIESGGWFGFLTPGFTLIAVENIVVTDDLPDGQGFISRTFNLTPNIRNALGNPGVDALAGGVTPLDETDIQWGFNASGLGITVADEFFRVDVTTRMLNDPVDLAYPVPGGYLPNLHAQQSSNIGRTSFDAIFNSVSGNVTINVDENAGVPGYPVEAVRRVDQRIIEPNLIISKEVCNETLSINAGNGSGANCNGGVFSASITAADADAGDSDDEYVYRVTITNEAASGGFARAPAYNVSLTDVLDASDLMLIAPGGATPFNTDGLDNDGDGLVDGADGDGEFFSLTENVADGGTAATFVISHQHSTVLEQIDTGAANAVTFYYRIDPDQDVAPLQTLSNTVTTQYDSLPGDFGNQNPPQLLNSENTAPNNSGRARIYTAIDASTSIQMLPLLTQPKQIIQLSNTVPGGPPQDVVVGEEILYELHAQIPVAKLRNFVIRDELPPGLRCVDTQTVNLNAAPYNAAQFRTDGAVNAASFAGSCDPTGVSNVVEWNFGNQELTVGAPGSLFDFRVRFIARVENTDGLTDEGCNIRNGGTAAGVPAPCTTNPSVARLTYVDESAATVTLTYGAVDVVVREPVINITKSFAPVTDADADDLLDITVTATNNGTATAYNLQVLDNLVGSNMTYVGVMGGTDPPDNDNITVNVFPEFGANQPVFMWNSGNPDFAIAPTETKTFTFRVQVNDVVQPHELLDNTIEARWTSLPDTTAINDVDNGTSRTIAADGDALGMRNGQLTGLTVNSANPPNDYNDTAVASVVVPELTIVKNDLNPAAVPAIGELKQFQIVISLPEGITNDLTISDDLASGAVSYFIENNADFDITYTFTDIATINTLAPSEAAFVDNTANAADGFPLDGTSGTVTWDIGTVDTVSENDSATGAFNPQIIITYTARINNDVNTDVGDTLQNGAALNYTNGEDASTEVRTDNTPQITVIEPLLTVAKTVSNLTQPGLDPDAGDVLEYVVTINNTGNATAFDTNIVDTIPAGVLLDVSAPATPTAAIDTVAVAGFVTAPTNSPAGPLIWGRNNGDQNLDIPAGSELVLTYRVIVQDTVEPLQPLNNSVVIDWTSLDGSSAIIDARERTGGADCSAIVAPNDYCAGPAVAVQTVSNLNNITKTYNSDTFTPFNDAQLRIGDTVQYTLTLSMQEGATTNIQLVDTLPEGMEFVSVDTINGIAGAPNFVNQAPFTHADIAPPVATTGVGTNTVTWTIGNVVNAPDNNAANNDFVIVYTAQVVNDELAMPQNPSTALLNSVDLTFDDVNNATVTQTDSATITALQPQILLADISKVRRSGILSGSPVTTGPSTGTGDVMDFELSACNSGQAPAYDLIIEDILSVEMNEASIRAPGDGPAASTPPTVILNGVVATAVTDYTYTAPAGPGGTMRFVFDNINNPLLPGECAVVQFDIDNNLIGINNSWDNSFQVVEYHSLDADDANVLERETYDTLIGPVLFNMHTIAPIFPPQKTLVSPIAPAEATIGELVTYQILVPDNPMTGTLFDVALVDNMSTSLTYVSSALDTSAANAYSGAIDDTGSTANQVRIAIAALPGGQQATINVVARVNNDAVTNNATAAFGNTVNYTFADAPAGSPIIGGGDATDPLNNISIIEPQVTLQNKTVVNVTNPGNPPDAGDILRYTLTMSASGGATFSDAYDVSIIDTLGLGLVYSANSTISAGVGTITDPGVIGDGVSTQQVMTWSLANGSNIDIPEGTANVTVTYDVLMLDSVLAGQDLTNSAIVQWTSIDGVDANERDGSGGVNDYSSGPLTTTVTTPDTNTVTKVRLSDTSPALNAANDVRIGDIVDYQISLSLQEGTSDSIVLTDTLPQGLIFEGIVSINGDTASPYANVAPFTHANILNTSAVAAGDPVTGPTTVTWTLGDITNAGANDGNNNFVIVYRARVLNLVQTPLNNPASNIALLNTVNFDYVIATGAAPTESDNETITIQQPNLTIVSKTAAPAGGDNIIVANEVITYTIQIQNTGQSPAYDVVLQDVVPVGLRTGTVPGNFNVTSVSLLSATPFTSVPVVYDSVTGIASWDFDSGAANQIIPAGDTLQIVYEVAAEASIGAGLSGLINTAQVLRYYSFDDEAVPTQGAVVGVREIYGPSNIASAAALSTPAPSPLAKVNPVPATASIGIPFVYRITVPATPMATALYDVRILDNLDNLAPGTDLIFVDVQKVSVPGSWVPVNTGTPTNLVIEDLTNGIDVPAGEQAILDLTVVLRNTSNNTVGDTFQNMASYTFNASNGDNGSQGIGGGSTTPNMTVIEPISMLLDKTGPAVMQFGTPETFTINVQNTGTGPAFDLTITDQLSNPAAGGMCDTPPNNFTAQITDAALTPIGPALVENTDFVTSFVGAPTCVLTITTTSAAAQLDPTNRLLVTYDTSLDADNINNALLDNVAAATQWFSGDTPAGVAVGEIRTYTEIIDPVVPGTPGVPDHQDVFTTQVAAPELVIEKTVTNVASGLPAFTAEPTETLRYDIQITNIGPVPATNFSLTDEPDRLNGTGYFAPGTMANIIAPGGADTTNTNINAGANAAGILDVRTLNLDAAGGANDSLNISFEITLGPVIDAGTIVTNQALIALTGFSALPSDDPNLPGATDPTETIIGSAPTFRLQKTSQDITGDTSVLRAGDILLYTLTAKNIGAENAINTILRDQVPANTSYVANTTTLNGIAVADPSAGVSPLQDGMLINAPEDTTAGNMRADSSATSSNVATITFNVMVDANVVNGTVISNQGIVGGDGVGSGPFAEQPSDDPTTDLMGDPTRDVVGNVAILDAQKIVELVNDVAADGNADAGDTLRYTITIGNSGSIPATAVRLTDAVPANTNYVANSTTLNGLAVADAGVGVSPLITGIDVSSADLTPPVPASNGTISAAQSAVVTFDVTVAALTPAGTVISNQGMVTSAEFPDELTDADGIDVNGDQPTEIIVGSGQQLSITKDVFVVGGGTAQPGDLLEYFIHVENTGSAAIDLSLPQTEVLKLFDDIDQLDTSLQPLLNYVPGSARLNGAVNGNVVFIAPRLIVHFDVSKNSISPNYMFEPGDSFTLRYLARIASTAVQGTNISNTVAVDWGTQDFTPVDETTPINCSGGLANVDACATVDIAVGGAPGVANISGQIWHDSNYDQLNQVNERVLEGWEVEIYFGNGDVNPGDLLDSVFTDANGNYTIQGLVPNAGDSLQYALRFRAPGSSNTTASLGNAISPFIGGNGPQRIEFFEVGTSSHSTDLSLPIQPNGVVYNSVLRTGAPQVRLELVNGAGVAVPDSCFAVDSQQQNQRTLADGYYKFELNFSQPGLCDSGDDYTIRVYPEGGGYFDDDADVNTPIISQIIPPALLLTDPAYDVPTCSGDALPTPECEVQTSEFAPPSSEAPRTSLTSYYLKLNLANPVPNEQLYNNHIAVDPELDDAVSISKTSAMVNVTRSQLVPYTITLNNTLPAPLYDLDLIDLFPAGFKYITGSARIKYGDADWIKIDPELDVVNLQLTWPDLQPLPADSSMVLKLLLVVGSGVGEGEYVNRAQAINNLTGGFASGQASATVRVVPDPTFDCSDIIGKVYDDKNMNAYQDEGEVGIGGARLFTAQGLEVTTDQYGRYHITCAVVPNMDRGSNFIVKLDERSLPTGYRLTTENPRVQRATRGKMLKYNFGAAIHRVVRLDMADAVFEPESTDMRPQWKPRLDMLISELAKDPSVLRLSYLAEIEDEDLVDDRVEAVKDIITERWNDLNCCYKLMIETEVFWRRGGPPDRGEFDD